MSLRLTFGRALATAMLLLAAASPWVRAAANVTATSTTFSPADSTRTAMDVGAVWNGTTRVDPGAGDVFTVTLANSGDTSAFDLSTRIELPAGFTRIGSASVSATSGAPTLTASQSGTTLTLATGGYDLPAGASITFTYQLTTSTAVAAGTYQLTPTWSFAATNGAALGANQTASQNVLVKAGAYTVAPTSTGLTLAVNQSGSFTYIITNTGLGGLFSVAASEALSNPGAAWDFTSFSAITAPRSTSLNGPADVVTIPYLAPGETLQFTVTGTVTACSDIANELVTSHLASVGSVTTVSPITLDLTQPLIDYTAPSTTLSYGVPVAVSLPIQNTGNGAARSLVLDTNYPALGVTISSVASGWSYNASSGRFTYTGSTPSGNGTGYLGNSSTVTLTYSIRQTDECGGAGGGTLLITPSYTNLCGNAFATPPGLGSVVSATNRPAISLSAASTSDRINISQVGSFTLTLAAENTTNISTSSVVVTATIPSGLTAMTLTASSGTASVSGTTAIWTVARTALTVARTLTIDFVAPADPCLGGNTLTLGATTNTLTTSAGCSLSTTASASFLLTNTTQGTVTQSFEVTPTASDGTFETGISSADAARDAGEGEFIPFVATYQISPGFAGVWAGSTYSDNFAGLAQLTLVPGTLEISLDGGAYSLVPGASVSGGTGSLTIDLGFLAGAAYYNTPGVAGASSRTVVVRYRATAPDAMLGAATSRHATQLVALQVASAGSGPGCGGGTFTQGAFYTIARAAATVSVAMPTSVHVCGTFPITLTVGNATPEYASHLITTFATSGDYEYVTGQTPTYGGAFTSGNITVAENGGTNPTFTFTGAELTSSGTITLTARRKPSTSTSATAASATVGYDDNETSPSAATREFSASGSGSPALVRLADLTPVPSPSRVIVADSTVRWTVYVVNGGSGDASTVTLQDIFPTGITPNAAATVSANPASGVFAALALGDASVSGATLTLSLGSIPAGYSRPVTLVGTVDGNQCSITSVPNATTVTWGCDSTTVQTRTVQNPDFITPTGGLQVLHDTTNTIAVLCTTSTAEIIVRNVGLARLSAAVISEEINSAASGLTFVPGTARYSLNGGAFNAASAAYDPSGTGTSGSPYIWDSSAIPELASLSPIAWGTGTNTVRIRFTIAANETTNATAPVVTASGTATVPCGDSTTSPGTPYTMPVQKPDITVVKTGINRTVAGGALGSGTFAKTVYAGSGDVVEWRVQITNNGNRPAENVRFRDTLAGSNGTQILYTSAGVVVDGAYTSGAYVALPDIAAASTVIYYVVETTGASCPDANNTASVEWGCDASAPYLTSPTTNTDTARLTMTPGFGGSLAGSITQTMTNTYPTVDNGRVRHVITLANGGGTARAVAFDLTYPTSMDLDTSVAGTVTGTSTYTGVTITGAHPTYHVELTNAATGRMRNGQTSIITLYAIQRASFDTVANTAAPSQAQACAYTMPETTGNSLDPALVSAGSTQVTLDLAFESTCGDSATRTGVAASLNPRSPDLDLTVTPTSIQMAPALAPYTYLFTFTITNAGNSSSTANRITFSLPTVGTDWATVTARLITPGTGGAAGTTSIAPYDTLNIGRLSQNQTAIVEVTATTSAAPTSANLVLVGQVEGSTWNQAAVDTTNNYSLDRAAPCVSTDFEVSGYLYSDANHNGIRDTSEAGTSIASLYAKLIDHTSPGAASQSAAINASTGFFQFTAVPQGEYTIIIDNNSTGADVTAMVTPTGWIGTEFSALIRDNVAVGVTSVTDQNFGLFAGSRLSGTVFRDDGASAGTANDGIRNGGEAGIPSAIVHLTNASGATVHGTASTDGTGSYSLWVPSALGTIALRVTEEQPSSWRSTGGSAGTTGGTYSSATDVVSFTHVVGSGYTGVDFGEVPASTLTHDGAQTVAAGSVADYAHEFTAGTNGSVTFTITDSATAGTGAWSHTLFRDADHDGALSSAEIAAGPLGTVALSAAETLALIVRDFSPPGAPAGAKHTLTLSAAFSALAPGNTVVYTETLTRTDVTSIGPGSTTGLDLVKEHVLDANCDGSETSGFSLEPLTSGAVPGACIIYRIRYTNSGSGPLSAIVIHDATPAYTTFQSASYGTPPANLGASVTVVAPAVGASGTISWTFTGTLAPGQSGEVFFAVRVSP